MSDNTCSICLEPLLVVASEDSVGAVVPCGHCFHSNCFALWKANKGSQCKCPNCNKPAKSCIKLFLAPAETSQNPLLDDQDDLSLDSHDTTSNDGKNGEAHSTSAQDASSSNDNNNINNNNAENSILIFDLTETSTTSSDEGRHSSVPPTIDLTSTPPRQSKATRSSTGTTGDTSTERYKGIAKQYKRRFQQKESLLRDLHQQHQTLVQAHSTMKEELGKIQTALAARDDMEQHFHAQMDGAKLKILRLERELQASTTQIQTLRKETKTWEMRYTELEKGFKDAVKKASHANMAEVKQLLEERPKILAENQRLLRELTKVQEQLNQWQKRTIPSSNNTQHTQQQNKAASSSDCHANNNNHIKKRKASAMARELRAMDEVHLSTKDPVHPLEDTSQPARTTFSTKRAKDDHALPLSTGHANSKFSSVSRMRSILREKSNLSLSRTSTLESSTSDSSYPQGLNSTVSLDNSKMTNSARILQSCPPDRNDPRRVSSLENSDGPRGGAFLNLSRPKVHKFGRSSLLYHQTNK